MGALSVIETLYSLLYIVFMFVSKSLGQTFTSILLMFEPYVQLLASFGFVALAIFFNPTGGSAQGTFQIMLIFLVSGLKFFLTFAQMYLNDDDYRYPSAVEEDVQVSDRRLYTFVSNKEPEQEQKVQPIYMIQVPQGADLYMMKP